MLVPFERRRAANLLRTRQKLLLHLGCADNYFAGWVNLDLARPGRRLDLRWDLRRRVPFPDRTIDAVFAEHLLEHLTLPAALDLVAECARVLREGGVCRIGVPDLGRYVASYRREDDMIETVRPERPTRALALSEIFVLYSHRSAYDEETLTALLLEAGFATAERKPFGVSAIDPAPDAPARRSETLYVEAIR